MRIRSRSKPSMIDSWLQDPSGTWAIRFHQDPQSWPNYPWVFVDRGRPFSDGPVQLKSRKHFCEEDALQIWKDLRKEGWKKVPPRW